jgi:hypothetical protein
MWDNAQQPLVLSSWPEPVLAMGFDELGQIAELERADGFHAPFFGPWLALDEGLGRGLFRGCEVKPGGAGSLILVIL